MTEYSVFGPFKVPVNKLPIGRRIGDIERFWSRSEEVHALRNRQGVYVFGMRAGRGITPYYVGKTIKGFERECFVYHKLDKYNLALASRAGKPVMFFIARPIKRGKVQNRQIKQIEKFFIGLGVAKNPELLNVQGKKQPRWCIAGVVRTTQGQPTKSAQTFKAMMNV